MPLPPIDTHDPAEMADLIAAFRAESLANERLIDKLETRLHESQAQLAAMHAADRQRTLLVDMLLAEIVALPKWTRITDDPATWPPQDNLVLLCDSTLTGYALSWPKVDGMPRQGYWLPITPPETDDDPVRIREEMDR